MSKQQALDALDIFDKGTIQAFKKLDRAKVSADLRARVNNPYLINQGTKAGICGPASIAFEIMRARPFTYVSAATRLFNLGNGMIGDWKISPDDDLLKADCPDSVAQGDWVMLASIRDSENWLMDFHDADDSYSSSSTLDEIAAWMKKAGFTEVASDEGLTNIFDKTDMLKAAVKKYDDGHHVILRINSNSIDAIIPKAPIAGNHVVVMTGPCALPAKKDDPISIPIYTWGQSMTLPRTGTLTYAQFLDQFFGYASAKY
jgi:hypothetical protein